MNVLFFDQADPAIVIRVVGPVRWVKVDDQAVDQVFDPGIGGMGLREVMKVLRAFELQLGFFSGQKITRRSGL
jgi:hypothetical protein